MSIYDVHIISMSVLKSRKKKIEWLLKKDGRVVKQNKIKQNKTKQKQHKKHMEVYI